MKKVLISQKKGCRPEFSVSGSWIKKKRKQVLSLQDWHLPPLPNQKPTSHKHKQKECYICGKKNHRMNQCRTYNRGPVMREKLRQLGRCDQCLLDSKSHSDKCRIISNHCKHYGSRRHFGVTCDGTPHPGSWIVRMKKISQK